MSFVAHMWSSGVAPIADVYEYAVLNRMADEVDECGEGCLLSAKTIARDIAASVRQVRRALDALLERKLIGEGDQKRAEYIRADRRPVVYDLLIPAKVFADLGRTNERRAAQGREPITEENRPVQDPPPADAKRKTREDAGTKRPRKLADTPDEQAALDAAEGVDGADQGEDGVSGSHPVTGGLVVTPSATGGLVVQHGVTGSPERGDYQSTDPGVDFDPGSSDPPTSAADEPAPAGAVAQVEERGEDAQPINLNDVVDAAVAVRADGSGWSVQAVRRAVREAQGDGWSDAVIVEALALLADDRPRRGHAGTQYPARLRHWLAAQARAEAAAPDDAETLPASYGMSSDRPRCRTHPGYPGDNCTQCVKDGEIVEAEAARAAAAAAQAAPAEESDKAAAARALARATAAAAAAAAAARRKRVGPRQPVPVEQAAPQLVDA